ncbi:hypothetical protein Tco_0679049 [Tanacetum coccineum]|uniref:Uncharacterized protein n=1 Tax=Tanacetum coccineum TaxID=301880 RepID=A0ABQ4XGR4_9ASTR
MNYYEPNPSYDSSGFDQPQPPQDSVDHQGILQALRKIQKELEEIKLDQRMKKENMSIEEMMREKIDDEYERDCEIKIEQLLQDYNGLGIEIRKKERILMEEKSLAVSRRIQSICDDDDEYSIQTQEYLKKFSSTNTPVLPIEELDNSLSMGDEHLDTILSIENLVPIPSEFEGISDETCDVPVRDDSSTFDVLNDHSEILSDSNNDGTSSDDDDYEDVEYEEVNDVDQEEKEFDLEDIFQIQDVILREKFLNINRLISNIESLKENPTPDCVLESPSSFPISVVDSDSLFEESDTSFSNSGNSLPEFESISDHTEETKSDSTTTHANYSHSEYDSFLFKIEPNQEGLISIVISDNSNDPLLELPEFESFHFEPSSPLPPSEPPDVEICLHFELDTLVIDNFNELNDDQRGRVKIRSLTPTSPLRAGGISSGWNFHDCPDFEDSRACGFVHSFELHILSFI